MKTADDLTNFSTDITDLAAFLIAMGAKVPILDRSNPHRIHYLFNLTEEQYAQIPKYHDGSGMVSGLIVLQAKKTLMGLIKSGEE